MSRAAEPGGGGGQAVALTVQADHGVVQFGVGEGVDVEREQGVDGVLQRRRVHTFILSNRCSSRNVLAQFLSLHCCL